MPGSHSEAQYKFQGARLYSVFLAIDEENKQNTDFKLTGDLYL